MNTAREHSSADLEKLFSIPLERAQKLATECRSLVDDVEEIARLTPDRALLRLLADRQNEGSIGDKLAITDQSVHWLLIELSERLLRALDEVNAEVKADFARDCARAIVAAAVTEGRIPPDGGARTHYSRDELADAVRRVRAMQLDSDLDEEMEAVQAVFELDYVPEIGIRRPSCEWVP